MEDSPQLFTPTLLPCFLPADFKVAPAGGSYGGFWRVILGVASTMGGGSVWPQGISHSHKSLIFKVIHCCAYKKQMICFNFVFAKKSVETIRARTFKDLIWFHKELLMIVPLTSDDCHLL